MRISFLPPPLDGTISLGIYDAKGKLVRVLHREADINEFKIGADALSTTWDGKDDAGENAPAGKYSAHGFVVGDLKIEGVGFFFNDFVTAARFAARPPSQPGAPPGQRTSSRRGACSAMNERPSFAMRAKARSFENSHSRRRLTAKKRLRSQMSCR